MTFTKFIGASIITIGLASGTALACDKTKMKNSTAMEKSETTQQTYVMPASADTQTTQKAKTYTFEKALEKCQAAGVADLQACVDKKTGATKEKS